MEKQKKRDENENITEEMDKKRKGMRQHSFSDEST